MRKPKSVSQTRLSIVDPDGNYGHERQRIQFDLGPMAAAQLDRLCGQLEQTSRAEVIRSAVRLYDWMVRMRLEGKEIHLKDGRSRSTTPVVLPLPGLGHDD